MKPDKYSKFRTSPEYREMKQEGDLFRRRIFFLGFLSSKLKEEGVDAILVGGEAIDLYTAGTFATSDIDLVVNNKGVTEKLLNKFEFARQGNDIWFNSDLNVILQVIDKDYSGDLKRLKKFRVKEYELRVAAPEDLIQNRLYSAKFWKSSARRDMEESVALLRIFEGTIDNSYLDRLAKENDIEDYLAEARKYASKA